MSRYTSILEVSQPSNCANCHKTRDTSFHGNSGQANDFSQCLLKLSEISASHVLSSIEIEPVGTSDMFPLLQYNVSCFLLRQ